MRSYASVDRIEETNAVCEVELLPIEQSKPEDFAEKETVMLVIPLSHVENVNEGDILVIEHDGKIVSAIYEKDDAEKARRLEVIRKIMEM